jgi:cytoskeleton protein RodZ
MQAKGRGKRQGKDSVDATESRLRVEREAAGISVDEVADRLHLDRDVILAIEAGDFDILGAPVFVKGHLRSYARLLGLSEDDVSVSHLKSEPEPEEFRTLSAPPTVKSGANLSSFLLWVLLALIALVVLIYFLVGDDAVEKSDFSTSAADEELVVSSTGITELGAKRLEEKESVGPAESLGAARPDRDGDAEDAEVADIEPVAAAVAGVDNSTADEPPPLAADQPETAAQVATTAAEPEAAAQSTSQTVAEPVALSLVFANECWVEVSDSKRRLLYGLEKSGTQRVLQGVPPFRLFLGNTDAVTIRVAGQEYLVPLAVRTGSNTARFSITKDVIAGMQNQ